MYGDIFRNAFPKNRNLGNPSVYRFWRRRAPGNDDESFKLNLENHGYGINIYQKT